MFFVVMVADYDGTLAEDGRVDAATIAAIQRVKRSGRKLILVTGRELPDLQRVFPELDLFDLVVAENGALLFDPGEKKEIALAEPPPATFVERLRDLGVTPLSVGRSIVATWEPNETIVLETIRDLGLELQIIFNKGAVMVLPATVNKATGLAAALARLELSRHNAVGVGDAENDLAFLGSCGCAVAVANAIPTVKAKADLHVSDHGRGVIELTNLLVDHDLQQTGVVLPKRTPVLGHFGDGRAVHIDPSQSVLITGSSGVGKSTVVTALLEQMRTLEFQFCVVDPEGDYMDFEDAVVVGSAKAEPALANIAKLLAQAEQSVIINLLAIDPADRPGFLAELLPELAKFRTTAGRPHWVVLDEAHHCLPAGHQRNPKSLQGGIPTVIAVTVHPEEVASELLEQISVVVGVGGNGPAAIGSFCRATSRSCGRPPSGALGSDQVHMWTAGTGALERIAVVKPQAKLKRHARKYAEGELGEDKSFYFRGSDGKLKLRAQNLTIFLQMAAGVDDETWLHHLRAGDYSRWFRASIKDKTLAAETERVEREDALSAAESRERVRELVVSRYTAPAGKSG